MHERDFFEALNSLPDDLILNASPQRVRKKVRLRRIRKAASVVTCLLLLIGICCTFSHNSPPYKFVYKPGAGGFRLFFQGEYYIPHSPLKVYPELLENFEFIGETVDDGEYFEKIELYANFKGLVYQNPEYPEFIMITSKEMTGYIIFCPMEGMQQKYLRLPWLPDPESSEAPESSESPGSPPFSDLETQTKE